MIFPLGAVKFILSKPLNRNKMIWISVAMDIIQCQELAPSTYIISYFKLKKVKTFTFQEIVL